MKFQSIKAKLLHLLKIISTVLIMGAIGLEIWNIYASLSESIVPDFLRLFIWLGIFAILAHFLEGILAAFLAFRSGKNSIKCGVYTFFTGTAGLLELFD